MTGSGPRGRGGGLALVLAAGLPGAGLAQDLPVAALPEDVEAIRSCLMWDSPRRRSAMTCVTEINRDCLNDKDTDSVAPLARSLACMRRERLAWEAALAEVQVVVQGHAEVAPEIWWDEAVPGARVAALAASDAAWLAFRDADCALEAAIYGASEEAPAGVEYCLVRRTAERAIEMHRRTEP